MKSPNFYAGCNLDRVGLRRKDDAWLKAALRHETSRFLPLWRSGHPVVETDGHFYPVILGYDAIHLWSRDEPLVLLGMDGEITFFAIELPEQVPVDVVCGDAATLADLRTIGVLLNSEDAGMLAYARGMLNWHDRYRYCGICGSPTESIQAGHVRHCSNIDCGTNHFPRTDSAVIMMVTSEDKCLLGRQAIWPEGMYSTLAGFVEPGESLESAVAREVFEEAGIKVGQVTYHSSQPWPYPGNLMLGFYAVAETTDIQIDLTELQDARWFERRWLRENPGAPGFRLPGKQSIARRLIEDWLA